MGTGGEMNAEGGVAGKITGGFKTGTNKLRCGKSVVFYINNTN